MRHQVDAWVVMRPFVQMVIEGGHNMTQQQTFRRALLRTTALAGVAAVGVGAGFAQPAEGDGDVEQIVVTGTRLTTNPNLGSPSPVLGIDSEEIALRGTVRVEDLTNILPQVFAGQATEVSNGATGTSTLNLRGLGATRTLVLIDGRRMPYGSSQSSPANVDMVPARLIERIDIVTGGASAVYGSDAVGGVANFILKNDFEGVEFNFQGGFNTDTSGDDFLGNLLDVSNVPQPDGGFDGRELFGSILLGANSPDGRGNVTLFASYQNLNAITQDNRDFSACSLAPGSGEFSVEGLQCQGSANFRLFGGPGGFFFQEEDGTIVPFQGGPFQSYNFGPLNYFQRPTERFNIYARSRYELTDDIEVYLDASFFNNNTDAQIAETASFGIGAYSINCDNPLIQGNGTGPDGTGESFANIFGCNVPDADGVLPLEVSGITASHRNVEGGPRNSNIDVSTWRFVGGFRGTLFDNVDWELFGQYSQLIDTNIGTNDFVIDNLQDAFFAVDDGAGNVVCRSGNSGCVPYNIFQRGPNGESLVTSDQTDFIQGVGITVGEVKQLVFGGTAQSDLGEYGIKSPFAESGIGFLAGWEYREDVLESNPDEITQVPGGGFTGVGGANLPIEGEIRVTEFFFETQIPLVEDQFLVEELAIGGAYRYSDYTTDGNGLESTFTTDTYYAYATWRPTEDVSFRGQFQRSVRAPNVIGLFTAQDFGLTGLSPGDNGFFDPCAGPTPAATLEQCAGSGVTADQYGNILDAVSGQAGTITGGNPELQPESSDTITFGAIFTPRWIDGLSISIDYFDIEIEDAIAGGVPAQTILDECVFGGNDQFCGFITRDAGQSLNSGTGTGFLQTNVNIATLATDGLDFQVIYNLDLAQVGLSDFGNINFDYASTWLRSLDTTPFPGGDVIECAGLYAGSCGTPNPTYRHRFLATWATPWQVNVSATWRYFSGTDFDGNAPTATDERLETVNYLDLSIDYQVTENLNIRGGALNLLGAAPPISTATSPPLGNGNVYPSVYDISRFVFFGIRVDI